MEINYNQMKNTRMGLNEALKSFSGEISYLTLKDGTCIEVMPDNYHPEKDYTDNQLQMGGENEDEFVEEKIDGNNPKTAWTIEGKRKRKSPWKNFEENRFKINRWK
jgi:hypothetical protein